MDTANTAKKKPKKHRAKIETPVPLAAYDMDQVAKALSCSTPIVYILVNDGLLETYTIGRRRYSTPRAVAKCVALLEEKGGALPMESGANNGKSPAAASPS